jgi:PKD repeat protein
MMQRPAATAGLLLLATLALSGCLSGDGGGAFGPGGSDDGGTATGVNEAGNGLALVFKASPAAGAAPLEVEVSLRATGAPDEVPWAIDFGDGSRPATGTGLPAEASHTYRKDGAMTVTATVGEGALASKAVLGIIVRPHVEEDEPASTGTLSSTTTQPPFQPPPPPPPPPSDTSSSTSGSSTTTAPPANSSTSTSASDTSTTTSETTTSTSETTTTTSETSSTTSETATSTSETTSTSDTATTAPTTSSTTTTSESQTTTTSDGSTTTEPQA